MASAEGPASGPAKNDWQAVDAMVQRFEEAWQDGGPPAIEDFVPKDGPDRLAVLIELVHVDLERRRQAGEPVRIEDYRECYPELAPFVNPTQVHEKSVNKQAADAIPRAIGRYRVEKILGQGGFGIVYLAHDDRLSRPVAIKVPHPKLVARPEDAKPYLTEARTVANLDHPNIVPVYDVGSSGNWPCFIVSKFIEGQTLAQKIKEDRPSLAVATHLVATIAEALQYAHRQGLVHRDVKPGNILIDRTGKPFVVDFGLALKEENLGRGPKYAGTPAYMSPEQARGEGHRVDGRSDVFSLGAVFYELLAGRQPFRGNSSTELLERVTSHEPRPLRQFDEAMPRELERICFKALSKRASERYMTAQDMADDLRHFLDHADHEEKAALGARTPSVAAPAPMPPSTPVGIQFTTPASDSLPIKIVPQGLRSFDEHDADFFLELLPGPRDRDDLPDSIRFWKTRIEEPDADKTFAVGLICGPSGCGKSSLVKAGLLPRLSSDVIVVYLEATGAGTETRLLSGLHKRCPTLARELSVQETLAALRRGQGLAIGKKVLIVLDQFEQWLHANKDQTSKLVEALRHCDGGRVQCLTMVRDDFWMAVIRFMRKLEIRLVEGLNYAALDLFDLDHAARVLASFGRAFGKLPESSGATSKEQKDFLAQAIQGMAQDGKVICVRLALFAEMMKGKSWTPASLRAMGGAAGVGITFLEETFSAATAPPEHRYHQKAARAVLKTLLPDSGANIKGAMRSRLQLLDASNYRSRPKDFDDLIRILDKEIRLITPTDPEAKDEEETTSVEETAGARATDDIDKMAVSSLMLTPPSLEYYQLTHDYLVPSLREWLTRKQKETKRGRAELLLADRAAVWNARPENRQLPSSLQWLRIRWWTRKKHWSGPQQKMMRAAGRYHALRGSALVTLLVIAAVTGLGIYGQFLEQNKAIHAAGLVRGLVDAKIAQVPGIITEMGPYRAWVDPLLREIHGSAPGESHQKLHASLALLPVDQSQKDYLYYRLLVATPQEVPVLRDALRGHKDHLLDTLWTAVEKPVKGKEHHRLRAASALASYDPLNERWASVREQVANDLVRVPAVYVATWIDCLRPVRAKIQAPLAAIYRDPKRTEDEHSLAAEILSDYAADQPGLLIDLIMNADEKQFAILVSRFKDQPEDQRQRTLTLLQSELHKQIEVVKVFEKSGTIAKDSPIVKVANGQSLPAKVFEVRLQTGKTYRMAMSSKELDSFLVLQDGGGKQLAFDDDSGGDLNARLVYTALKDGSYHVFAASLEGTGSFSLTIEELIGEEEKLAKGQANAAIALLRMDRPDNVWPLLRHSPDPRLRSYLIHRLGPLGVDAGAIIRRLDEESDVTIRRALILSLGEFKNNQVPLSAQAALIDKLLTLYEHEPDAGLHGAAEWLLRQWAQEAKISALEDKLRTNEGQLYTALKAHRTQQQQQRLLKLSMQLEGIQKSLADRQTAWEGALRERAAEPHSSLEQGLLAHYSLNETAGRETANAVKDQPGGDYRGTGSPEWVPGVVGGALRLDGNGTVVGGKPLDVECDRALSYGCWFQHDGKPPTILMSTRDKTKGRGFELGLENDHQLRAQIVGENLNSPEGNRKSSPFALTVITVTNNDSERRPGWHHVLVTYDGSKKARGIKIFVDGESQPTQVLDNNLAGTLRSEVPIHLGSRHGELRFRGKLDDVRIYNRCLYDKEARQLYESGIHALARNPGRERSPEQQNLLADYYRGRDETSQRLHKELGEATVLLRKTDWASIRSWYISTQGQTMVVIPAPVEFMIGSPRTEHKRSFYERQSKIRISRTFAIAAKPVTKEQFLRFLPQFGTSEMYRYPSPTCPIGGVTWYEAAAYCNWLSKQEGIEPDKWCYETNSFGQVAKLKDNYLSLTGYRLPTEAEMEYAIRAEALTSRCYGEVEELLGKYGWFSQNSGFRTWPVGSKMPNDFGLFDGHGNVICWCQDNFKPNYPRGEPGKAVEDREQVAGTWIGSRVLRGGSFGTPAWLVRSATRLSNLPSNRSNDVGVRPARTISTE